MMAIAGLVFSASTGGKVSSVLLVAIPLLLIALTIIMVLASRYSIRLRKNWIISTAFSCRPWKECG